MTSGTGETSSLVDFGSGPSDPAPLILVRHAICGAEDAGSMGPDPKNSSFWTLKHFAFRFRCEGNKERMQGRDAARRFGKEL